MGAGVSAAAGVPTWKELVYSLSRRLGIKSVKGPADISPRMLLTIPQYYENVHSQRELVRFVREEVSERSPSSLHQLLAQLRVPLYYTTNFDELLELALVEEDVRYDLITDERSAHAHAERSKPQVRKIHGTISRSDIVVTRTDFSKFAAERPVLADDLRFDLRNNTFLFIGYSLTDPDFNSIYDQVLFAMKGMEQRHFVCLLDPDEYEVEDLRRRSFSVVDLEAWPGSAENDKLASFLNQLVEATGEMTHIRRFFRGLKQGDRVQVVLTSQINANEQYLSYPACDIHVATAITNALSMIGVTTSVIPDRVAMESPDEFLRDNLILICAPMGNAFTRHVYEKAQRIRGPTALKEQRFIDDESGRAFLTSEPFHRYASTDPLQTTPGRKGRDHSLIARYRNPWKKTRNIWVVGGVYAVGTEAAGDFLDDLANYRRLSKGDESAAALLQVDYHAIGQGMYERAVSSVMLLSPDEE